MLISSPGIEGEAITIMSRSKKQLYVVVNGRIPGIYDRWFGEGGAAEQVEGFPEAIYKGFHNQDEAIAWLRTLSRQKLAKSAPNLLDLVESSAPLPDDEDPQKLLQEGKVLIYTDGGTLENPGPGGYGVVLRFKNHRREISCGYRMTTNNRMELMACIAGLEALKKTSQVVIFSDSQYVVINMLNGRAEGWQVDGWVGAKEHVIENADLWEKLLALCAQHEVEFRWLRGHSGQPDNERCDELARAAARQEN